uniref:Uncharacterized protein n=1 Tax=Eutreptiella gymnastica TaxID=73025 RepID=A0A7S1INK0_9EUGL|mmetsp:Transcript_29777/g.53515  ORF Transcript_29777/g.53515 Transcript_29777/m.53515 type:complete len:839 (+) Transcript_29777:127-2643(+)
MADPGSIDAVYAQLAALMRTLAADRAAILEPAQKRLAIQTLKAKCEAMFPAIRRVMYETQCEPNLVVECRAALRDLQAQIEEQEKRLDFAHYLKEQGLPNISAETNLERSQRWDKEHDEGIVRRFNMARSGVAAEIAALRAEVEHESSLIKPLADVDQASAFVSPLGCGSEGSHEALKATYVLADGLLLDKNHQPSLQVSAISMDVSDSDMLTFTSEAAPPGKASVPTVVVAAAAAAAAGPSDPSPSPEAGAGPVAPGNADPPHWPAPRAHSLWQWRESLLDVLPPAPGALLPPACLLLQRATAEARHHPHPVPWSGVFRTSAYAVVPIHEVTVPRLVPAGPNVTYQQVIPRNICVNPYLELWPGATEGHVYGVLRALQDALGRGLNCYVRHAVVLHHREGMSLPTDGAALAALDQACSAAPPALSLDPAAILFQAMQSAEPPPSHPIRKPAPPPERASYAIHLMLEDSRCIASFADWALFLYKQLHDSHHGPRADPRTPPAREPADLLAAAAEQPLLAINPRSLAQNRAFRLPGGPGGATVLTPGAAADPDLKDVLGEWAPPDPLRACLACHPEGLDPVPETEPKEVQVPKVARFSVAGALDPLPKGFRDDGDPNPIPTADELRDAQFRTQPPVPRARPQPARHQLHEAHRQIDLCRPAPEAVAVEEEADEDAERWRQTEVVLTPLRVADVYAHQSNLLNGMAESKTRRRHLTSRLQEVREEHAMQAADVESAADEERRQEDERSRPDEIAQAKQWAAAERQRLEQEQTMDFISRKWQDARGYIETVREKQQRLESFNLSTWLEYEANKAEQERTENAGGCAVRVNHGSRFTLICDS